ncbi:hypothetical protein FZEAL_6340 [Fusarium zealandicum]|uniref:Uncharacterized protein n=1 Tax=Fusarium zealandicum TaxID=1053134 RepID=A0A8H4UII6_9HYPO|nr:hypothetical protein FZEAL_6340 [Fusarium zealandicum]
MTVPTHFHMPGAFHGEGVHPGLFRPPMSPSSSASYGYAAPRTTATHDAYATKRKRHRQDMSRSQDLGMDDDLDRNGFFGTPVAQTRHEGRCYQLAGQLDTPNSGPFESGVLGESMYSDSDYRRALGSKRAHDDIDRSDAGPTSLFNFPPQPTPSQGWGSFAFSTLGGVVGRVWEFCRIGAFGGFQAGGGRAFSVTSGRVEELSLADEKMSDNRHIPGHFPSQGDYFSQQPEHPSEHINSGASTPTAPAPKRRHTDQRDELGRNWVMVDDQEPPEPKATPQPTPQQRHSSYRSSPRSRNSGPSMATGRRISTPASRFSSTSTPSQRRTASRPSSRLSHAPTPSLPSLLPASTASFASPRSSSPSKIPTPSRRRNSIAPSPTPGMSSMSGMSHRRSHSNASTASGRASVHASPRLDSEAKHLAQRRKIEERDADVRISAFNKQLQDMIRQGREALGTTIEVEGNWEEDDDL